MEPIVSLVQQSNPTLGDALHAAQAQHPNFSSRDPGLSSSDNCGFEQQSVLYQDSGDAFPRSQHILPYAPSSGSIRTIDDATSDSGESAHSISSGVSLRLSSPIRFGGSVASHATSGTELTTPESATVVLPKSPEKDEIYLSPHASPHLRCTLPGLPSADPLSPTMPTEVYAPETTTINSGSSSFFLAESSVQAQPVASPLLPYSTAASPSEREPWPVLTEHGRSPSTREQPHEQVPNQDHYATSSSHYVHQRTAQESTHAKEDIRREAAVLQRLEQSFDALAMSDDDGSGDTSQYSQTPPPTVRALESERVIMVFRSPAATQPMEADLDTHDSLASRGSEGEHREDSLTEDSLSTGSAALSTKRAVLMSSSEAHRFLGFTPETEMVVSTVQDASESSRRALLCPGAEVLDIGKMSCPATVSIMASEPSPSQEAKSQPECGPNISSTESELADFSFLCDVMDTSTSLEDSFYSAVPDQSHEGSFSTTLANTSFRGFPHSTAPQAEDQPATPPILSRPRPRTSRSKGLSTLSFGISDAPLVTPKRRGTTRHTTVGANRTENTHRQQRGIKSPTGDQLNATGPPQKFDLPIRPRSVRRRKGERKWTVAYVDSTARGVPREYLPGGDTVLNRARFSAKPRPAKRAPLALLPPDPRTSPETATPLRSEQAGLPRERYPTMQTLFPNYKEAPKPAASTAVEDEVETDASFRSLSQLRQNDLPGYDPEAAGPSLNLLVNLTRAQNKDESAKDTEKQEKSQGKCGDNGTKEGSRNSTVQQGTKMDGCQGDENQVQDRLTILREAIALAQEEVARLEAAEHRASNSSLKAQKRKKKSSSLLAGLVSSTSRSSVTGAADKRSEEPSSGEPATAAAGLAAAPLGVKWNETLVTNLPASESIDTKALSLSSPTSTKSSKASKSKSSLPDKSKKYTSGTVYALPA